MITILAFPLFLAAAVVLLVTQARQQEPSSVESHVIRRVFQYILLYGLLIIAAVGVAGLFARAIEPGALVTGGDMLLARNITFTVIGLPLLGAVGYWVRRDHRAEPAERDSLWWTLYLAAADFTALILMMSAAHSLLAWALRLHAFRAEALAGLIVWGAVWGAHRGLAHRTQRPEREQMSLVLGAMVGLLATATGVALVVAGALRIIVRLEPDALVLGATDPARWGVALLAVGAPVWLLYWWGRLRRLRGSGRDVAWLMITLLLGMGGGLAATLAATSVVLYKVLVWLVGSPGTTDRFEFFDPLPLAAGVAVTGGLVWWYHQAVMNDGPAPERSDVERVRDYLLAAVALASASAGIILVVVAVVEAITGSVLIAGDAAVNTLIAALTLLVVGIPTWWWFWRSGQRAARDDPDGEYRAVPRRVYILMLLGIASLVAVGALLAGTYIVVEGILAADRFSSVLREMRYAIAVLVAAGVVAGYHWKVWAEERRRAVTTAPLASTGRHILLVGPADAGIAAVVGRAIRGTVRLRVRTDVSGSWDLAAVTAAIAEHPDGDLLILAGDPRVDGGLQVVPLRRD